MAVFRVNGCSVTADRNVSLMLFLRDELKLTSVKCGCDQGACGTCTVIIDGVACRACVRRTDKLEGAEVVTAEGLSPREREVFTYAFSAAGAVQCGYCTPGMVLSAKALLDRNPSPTENEIREALKHNVCRCTGYGTILKAVLLAADLLRSDAPVPELPEAQVGLSAPRIDAADKITGRLKYVADDIPEGALYGAIRTAGVAHARILKIDTSAAKQLPGVSAVLTAEDIPGSRLAGWLHGEWPVMVGAGEEVLFPGDVVALAAAETPSAAKAALDAVKIDYEPLPAVFSATEALAPHAPQLHKNGNVFATTEIHLGDAETADAETRYRVHRVYTTPFAEQGFLELEAATVIPDGDRLIIRSADQSIYLTRAQTAKVLAIPPDRILVEGYPVGGAFGGREDVLVQIQAALLAKVSGRTVFLQYTREQSHLIHAKKHPMTVDVTSGCDENGRLTFLKLDVLADKGAYPSLGLPVLERACSMAPGPYRYKRVDIVGRSVYTDNPPTGGYRGFGITQTCFGVETNLDLLAEQAGISPWEIRYRNAIVPGDRMYNGQIADASTAVQETLLAVKEEYENAQYAGIACGMKNCGSGSGLKDVGRCTLRVRNGQVEILSAASMMGQGVETVLTQIAATVTGLPAGCFVWPLINTAESPDAGPGSASRMTVLIGEAARRASEQLKESLSPDHTAAEALRLLEGRSFTGEYSAETVPPSPDAADPIVHVAYGYATHVAVLNEDGTVKKLVAAHDVGRAINPAAVKGQIEGGAVMSFGYALTENFAVREGTASGAFGTVGFPTAVNTPPVESIIVEKSPLELALGAKGLGELTCIPTPAALAAAYRARDGKLRTAIPLEDTPYRPRKKENRK